jgi:hypothetical protein
MKLNRIAISLGLNIGLALLMFQVPLVATIHAITVLAIGVFWGLFGKRAERVAYISAYIVGSEILWRMCNAEVYWEYGKYSLALVLLIGILRLTKKPVFLTPLIYFFLLLVSSVLTLRALGLTEEARQAISFNLSGPFALSISLIFFYRWSTNVEQIKHLLLWLLSPVLGVASIGFFSTVTAENLRFTLNSNFVTSGGFGPNQVSAILGLGAVVCSVLFVLEKSLRVRCLLIVLTIWLLIQGGLTFSRGGIFNAAMCMALLFVHSLGNRQMRNALIILVVVLMFVGGYLIVPYLEEVTGGRIVDRFSSFETTNRADIAAADLEVWFDNFLMGVGPGMARTFRTRFFGGEVAAHTEFTRTLAEHGLLGLIGGLLLLWASVRTYFRAPTGYPRAWIAIMSGWALAEMSHAAMRIAAISFIFSLAFIQWRNIVSDAAPERRSFPKFGVPASFESARPHNR